jgi:hypothetical protein
MRTPASVAVNAPRLGRRAGWVLAVGGIGVSLIGAGALLPWVILFRGLQPISGFTLDGGYLSGIAIAAAILSIVAGRSGGSRLLRPLATLGAVVVTVDALYAINRIAAFVADPGPTGPLSQPAPGPGAEVMAAGGILMLIAIIGAPARPGVLPSGYAPRLTIGFALFASAWIHLVLAPQHLAESAVLGLGFVGAGLAQLTLAATLVARPRAGVYYGVIVVNVALIFFYVVAVAVGLPFGDHDHGSGIVVGSGEAIDLPGAISKGAELVSLILAVWLLGRPIQSEPTRLNTDRLRDGFVTR